MMGDEWLLTIVTPYEDLPAAFGDLAAVSELKEHFEVWGGKAELERIMPEGLCQFASDTNRELLARDDFVEKVQELMVAVRGHSKTDASARVRRKKFMKHFPHLIQQEPLYGAERAVEALGQWWLRYYALAHDDALVLEGAPPDACLQPVSDAARALILRSELLSRTCGAPTDAPELFTPACRSTITTNVHVTEPSVKFLWPTGPPEELRKAWEYLDIRRQLRSALARTAEVDFSDVTTTGAHYIRCRWTYEEFDWHQVLMFDRVLCYWIRNLTTK